MTETNVAEHTVCDGCKVLIERAEKAETTAESCLDFVHTLIPDLPAVTRLVEVLKPFLAILERPDSRNYVTTGFVFEKAGTRWSLTAQREDGATPSEHIGKLRAALEAAEAALSDIGDGDREPGDDMAWCERRAAQALPEVRAALAPL